MLKVIIKADKFYVTLLGEIVTPPMDYRIEAYDFAHYLGDKLGISVELPS